MNCNETFNVGICCVTDAYKSVCKFNEELRADIEKYRAENEKLRNAAAMAWRLFAAHPCDLPRVDAVRNELRELGIEVDA